MSGTMSRTIITGCEKCPIDNWVHGCHLEGDECTEVTEVLESSIHRHFKPYFDRSEETKNE